MYSDANIKRPRTSQQRKVSTKVHATADGPDSEDSQIRRNEENNYMYITFGRCELVVNTSLQIHL